MSLRTSSWQPRWVPLTGPEPHPFVFRAPPRPHAPVVSRLPAAPAPVVSLALRCGLVLPDRVVLAPLTQHLCPTQTAPRATRRPGGCAARPVMASEWWRPSRTVSGRRKGRGRGSSVSPRQPRRPRASGRTRTSREPSAWFSCTMPATASPALPSRLSNAPPGAGARGAPRRPRPCVDYVAAPAAGRAGRVSRGVESTRQRLPLHGSRVSRHEPRSRRPRREPRRPRPPAPRDRAAARAATALGSPWGADQPRVDAVNPQGHPVGTTACRWAPGWRRTRTLSTSACSRPRVLLPFEPGRAVTAFRSARRLGGRVDRGRIWTADEAEEAPAAGGDAVVVRAASSTPTGQWQHPAPALSPTDLLDPGPAGSGGRLGGLPDSPAPFSRLVGGGAPPA